MSFFFNLSTKAKLMTCFGIVILINVIISLTTLNSLNNVQNSATKIEAVLNGAFTRIFTLQTIAEDAKEKFNKGLNSADTGYVFSQLSNEASSVIQRLRESANDINPDSLGDPTYRDMVMRLRDLTINSINTLEREILPMANSGQIREAFDLYLIKV